MQRMSPRPDSVNPTYRGGGGGDHATARGPRRRHSPRRLRGALPHRSLCADHRHHLHHSQHRRSCPARCRNHPARRRWALAGGRVDHHRAGHARNRVQQPRHHPDALVVQRDQRHALQSSEHIRIPQLDIPAHTHRRWPGQRHAPGQLRPTHARRLQPLEHRLHLQRHRRPGRAHHRLARFLLYQ